MYKTSNCFLPGDIQYLGEDDLGKVYSCVMPITGVREEFTVESAIWASKVIPRKICDLANYIEEIKRVLNVCRDFQPMRNDLQALDSEEARLFDARYHIDRPKKFHRKA